MFNNTLHRGQSILIGANIEIKIIDIRSNTARMQVFAPEDISTHRREIFDALKAGKKVFPKNNGTLMDISQFRITSIFSRAAAPPTDGSLIIPRRAGESIMIGDQIEITVKEIDSNNARLVIAAPRDVPLTPKKQDVSCRFDAPKGAKEQRDFPELEV